MNKIKASLLAVAFSLSVVACGGGGMKAEAEALANKVCECKDMKCVAEVQKASQEKNKDAKPTADDMKAMAPSIKKMGECIAKLGAPAKK